MDTYSTYLLPNLLPLLRFSSPRGSIHEAFEELLSKFYQYHLKYDEK
jgi:hypothetical protein